MATTLTSAGFNTASPLNQTQTKIVQKAAVIDQRNVARKPVTLYAVIVDNMFATASNDKVWFRLYDDVSDSWNPTNTKSLMGFPVEKYLGAGNQLNGTFQAVFSRTGITFGKGISIAASLGTGSDVGGEITATSSNPATDVAVELVHS